MTMGKRSHRKVGGVYNLTKERTVHRFMSGTRFKYLKKIRLIATLFQTMLIVKS